MSEENQVIDPASGGWHLDKRIPIALIATLLLQTSGFAFWMGQISIRIEQVESQVVRAATNGERLSRLEVQIDLMKETLIRIDDAVQVLRDQD